MVDGRRTSTFSIDERQARVWAVLWDEARWPAVSSRIASVDVIEPGDRFGNGRLRRVRPSGRVGQGPAWFERVTDVAQGRSFAIHVHQHDPIEDAVIEVDLRPSTGRHAELRLVEARRERSWALRRWHQVTDADHQGSAHHALAARLGPWLATAGSYRPELIRPNG